jgi:hypothetical protein
LKPFIFGISRFGVTLPLPDVDVLNSLELVTTFFGGEGDTAFYGTILGVGNFGNFLADLTITYFGCF